MQFYYLRYVFWHKKICSFSKKVMAGKKRADWNSYYTLLYNDKHFYYDQFYMENENAYLLKI